MTTKRYAFTDEESVEMKNKLTGIEDALGLFFQEHTLKRYELWVDEAVVNGVESTLLRFNKYVDDFHKDKPSMWDIDI